MKDRCYLVYALAPESMDAREANDRLNTYIAERSRGTVAFHDHFVGKPHGGLAVFHVRDDTELGKLDDRGPLEGWALSIHPLTFSLTAVGLIAQAELTMEEYSGSSLEELRASEPDDKRYWWRRR